MAKTLAINTLAHIINAKFSRIQFTPDLLPADVVGTMIYSQKRGRVRGEERTDFINFILADEINRARRSAIGLVGGDGASGDYQGYDLQVGRTDFLVMAKSIEQEGTYLLFLRLRLTVSC